MASTKLVGDKIIAQLDLNTVGGAADWALIGCITDSDVDGTRETIDASSKCGPDQLPGQQTNTVNLTGFLNTTPGVDEVSLNELAAIYDSTILRHFRLMDDEGGDLYYREFFGYLTAWNESSNQNEPVTFTAAIAVSGNVIRVLPVS